MDNDVNTTEIEVGSVSILPAGEYSSTKQYERLSVVSYQGSAYIARQASKGQDVSNQDYWFLLVSKGEVGNGIVSIEKTGTEGLVDTYTITYTNGTTNTFTVTNGNFSPEDKEKLDGIENGAQVNKIEKIKVNGVEQTIGTDKSVDIEIEGGGSIAIQTGNQIISKGTTIVNEYEITLPLSYVVGNNSLELFWNGSRLIKATDISDGHYKEIGTVGQTSNIIKMHRTTNDGTYTLPDDVVLETVVTGAPTITIEEGGTENADEN